MKRAIQLAVAFFAVLVVTVGHAQAGIIWYNGDPNLVTGLANEINSSVNDAQVYDDFNVTTAVNVTEVFSNNFMNFSTSSAAWEIRSGVSDGNSGTLVAGGTSAAIQTANGFDAFGLSGFRINVTGLSINLSPGTYWLAVTPIGTGSGRSFVQTTSGANALGTPPGNNQNAYFDSASFGANFQTTADFVGMSDFSMGVATAVPEPSSIALFGIGACVAGIRARRRRRLEKQQQATA